MAAESALARSTCPVPVLTAADKAAATTPPRLLLSSVGKLPRSSLTTIFICNARALNAPYKSIQLQSEALRTLLQ